MSNQNNNDKKVKVSVKIDPSDKKQLEELAEQDGSNFSTIVRRAVKKFIKK